MPIPTVVAGRNPLQSEICAQSNPPLRKTPTSTNFLLITSQLQETAKKVQL